jgi:hypothetical protein
MAAVHRKVPTISSPVSGHCCPRGERTGDRQARPQKRFFQRAIAAVLCLTGSAAPDPASAKAPWEDPAGWTTVTDGESAVKIRPRRMDGRSAVELEYDLRGSGWRWVDVKCGPSGSWPEDSPIAFWLKAEAPASLEFKAVDRDGSTFLYKIALRDRYTNWTPVVLYRRHMEYGWGGDSRLGDPVELHLALAGPAAPGTVWVTTPFLGEPGSKATVQDWQDPYCHDPGFGIRQRRARALLPEDPLVLEWLKAVQDVSSPERQLLSSMEDNIAQTFNNALAAMAFILKGEKQRAERILDFYAARTDPGNTALTRQNFFYRGEARGFYQSVLIRDGAVPAYHSPGSDRWMGDMAWLLIAYHHYGKAYDSARYAKITDLLKDLLIDFYKPDPAGGGYVQHGWRANDSRLHESGGHPEGNIDAYAAFKLSGETGYAANVKRWIERTVKGAGLPLDLYTWRVLAFGGAEADLLSIPDCDLRYRKTLKIGGSDVVGVFHSAAPDVNNIWLDGVGHMACAYYAADNIQRGHFYSNQLDKFLIDRLVGGKKTRTLPYAANAQGDLGWVAFDKGFVSTAAWYIFAKNRFNPLTLTQAPMSEPRPGK